MIRIGIAGSGEMGKAPARYFSQRQDTQVTALFTRRPAALQGTAPFKKIA